MTWGAEEWGVTPWGGAPAFEVELRLVAAESIRENVVRLTFNQAVYFSRWGDPDDGAEIDLYQVIADPTAIGVDGEPSRPVFPVLVEQVVGAGGEQLDLTLDRAMSPWGARYTVVVAELVSAGGLGLEAGYSSAVVDGQQLGRPQPLADLAVGNRDFANPQSLSALLDPLPVTTDVGILGTFPTDETGDYAVDEGLTSYRKRVYRRLTTRKGAFKHLPEYGSIAVASLKHLAQAGVVATLAADAEAQIRQEPETVDVSVRIVQVEAGLFRYRVRVQTSLTAHPFEMDAPVVTSSQE